MIPQLQKAEVNDKNNSGGRDVIVIEGVTDDDDLLRDLERRDGGMLESKFCGATIGARSSAVQLIFNTRTFVH